MGNIQALKEMLGIFKALDGNRSVAFVSGKRTIGRYVKAGKMFSEYI